MHLWPIFLIITIFPVDALIPISAKKCQDHVAFCGHGSRYCFHPKIGHSIRINCPVTCGICSVPAVHQRKRHRKHNSSRRHKARSRGPKITARHRPRKPNHRTKPTAYRSTSSADHQYCKPWISREICSSARLNKFCRRTCGLYGKRAPRKTHKPIHKPPRKPHLTPPQNTTPKTPTTNAKNDKNNSQPGHLKNNPIDDNNFDSNNMQLGKNVNKPSKASVDTPTSEAINKPETKNDNVVGRSDDAKNDSNSRSEAKPNDGKTKDTRTLKNSKPSTDTKKSGNSKPSDRNNEENSNSQNSGGNNNQPASSNKSGGRSENQSTGPKEDENSKDNNHPSSPNKNGSIDQSSGSTKDNGSSKSSPTETQPKDQSSSADKTGDQSTGPKNSDSSKDNKPLSADKNGENSKNQPTAPQPADGSSNGQQNKSKNSQPSSPDKTENKEQQVETQPRHNSSKDQANGSNSKDNNQPSNSKDDNSKKPSTGTQPKDSTSNNQPIGKQPKDDSWKDQTNGSNSQDDNQSSNPKNDGNSKNQPSEPQKNGDKAQSSDSNKNKGNSNDQTTGPDETGDKDQPTVSKPNDSNSKDQQTGSQPKKDEQFSSSDNNSGNSKNPSPGSSMNDDNSKNQPAENPPKDSNSKDSSDKTEDQSTGSKNNDNSKNQQKDGNSNDPTNGSNSKDQSESNSGDESKNKPSSPAKSGDTSNNQPTGNQPKDSSSKNPTDNSGKRGDQTTGSTNKDNSKNQSTGTQPKDDNPKNRPSVPNEDADKQPKPSANDKNTGADNTQGSQPSKGGQQTSNPSTDTKSGSKTNGGNTKPEDVKPAYEPFRHSIDLSTNPCDDFYQYSCGRWIQEHPIPQRWNSRTFITDANDKNHDEMEKILKSLNPKSEEENELKRFYDLCVDESSLRNDGVETLVDVLLRRNGWALMGKIRDVEWDAKKFLGLSDVRWFSSAFGIQTFLDVTTENEELQNEVVKVHLSASNLPFGMSADDFNKKEKLEIYRKFLQELVTLFAKDAKATRSTEDMTKDLEKIIAFQGELIKVVMKNKNAVYEDVDMDNLSTNVNEYIKSGSDDQLYQNFLQTHRTIRVKNAKTVEEIYDVSFKDDLRGQKSSFNRNSYCYDLSLRFFADLSDQLFLEKYLPATEEKYFKNFVEKLRTQYVETWFEVSWMSENDKKVAVDKFKGLKFIYPTIKKRKRIDLVKNYERMNFVQLVELLQRLRRNEDFRAAVNEEDTNDDWEERQNLIAYVFHFNKNKLFIPSAIAKDPFYQQKTKTQALNYGMTGQYLTGKMVMLVLNTGATIDSTLKTRDWWSAETTKQYKATLQCMTNAFKKTELEELPGTKLSNNEDTMEEYLGIQFAYEAYKKNVGNSDPTLLGYSLTGEQNFFISYAMRNCANLNVNGLRYLIKQGEIPEKYQVNVLLANTEAFAKAFSCPVGSAMNPKDKCKPY